jgi:photosystem II stability/assembly factor-like uncharacterized protein
MFKPYCLFFLMVIFSGINATAQHVQLLQQGTRTSIRGLSVVDDSVAWVSGSRGNIGKTTDGGKTWTWQQVKGFEKADFRDIEAFSDREAVIISSGTPALILKTTDGGSNWQVKYRNTDSLYFLDAMDFDTPKHGLVLGDPIKNKFLLLETNDAAETWHPFKSLPEALTGEAAFAASGTCLAINKGQINIASGGTAARLLIADLKKPDWRQISLPIMHGKSSTGSFAVANQTVVVGGNYAKDKLTDSTACYSPDHGKTWLVSTQFPAGFQSGVEHIEGSTYIATGTSGSNISTDQGKTWTKIDGISYNVCSKARRGNLILLAGDGGKIGILKF